MAARKARIWCLAGAAAVVGLCALPAAAQTITATTTPSSGAATTGAAIQGRLASGSVPVPGVVITVVGVEPAGFEAQDTSDADGNWSVPVPGPGTYRVAIDTDTIPDGFALENADRTELPQYRVFGSAPQNAAFPFASDEGGGIEVPERWERLLNLLVSGVRLGLIIGVCSVGLSLIFGTTGLVNFAHGELVTLGALVAWYFNTSRSGPELALTLAVVLALVVSGLFGAVLELGLWRPMLRRRSGNVARMLVSIGLALALRNTYQVIFGSSPRSFRQYSSQPPIDFGPLNFPLRDYVIMAICVVLLIGVGLVLQLTRLGTAVRAVADERDLAAASGVDVRRVVLAVWIGGAVLTGFGGVMLGISQVVQWNMGFRLLLTMFAAVVLGGLGSAYGAMAGGLAVGMASEVSTYWIDADFKFAVALVILILVLLVRPQGILGIRERVG